MNKYFQDSFLKLAKRHAISSTSSVSSFLPMALFFYYRHSFCFMCNNISISNGILYEISIYKFKSVCYVNETCMNVFLNKSTFTLIYHWKKGMKENLL